MVHSARPALVAQHIVVHYERTLEAPLDAAYAWLTDYQDDDPSRTTKVVKKRPVISRTKDVVVLEGEIEVLGNKAKGRAEVHLFPPDRWEARFTRRDGSPGSRYEYRLVPQGADRCRLVVDYRLAARRWTTRLRLMLLKPLVYRELDQMWDGFIEHMVRDLAVAPPQRTAR